MPVLPPVIRTTLPVKREVITFCVLPSDRLIRPMVRPARLTIGAAIGCLALIAFRTRTRIRPTVWRWAFAGVCAVTVAALWPYCLFIPMIY